MLFHILGNESYENQKEYGEKIFNELHDMKENGVEINEINHKIHLVCSCDWKASACIEGIWKSQMCVSTSTPNNTKTIT